MSMQEPQLSALLKWRPWPPGDPAPEIWSIILDLDRRFQLEVVDAVLSTQIAMARAYVDGLERISKVVAGAREG